MSKNLNNIKKYKKDELTNTLLNDLKSYFLSQEFYYFKQSPIWKSKDTNYYIGYNKNDEIIAYTSIQERGKNASINFGPVCVNDELTITFLEMIINDLKAQGYFYLGVLLPYGIGNSSEYIQNKIWERCKFKSVFDSTNWCTWRIPLVGKKYTELQKKYSKNHKRNIKKALKQDLKITFSKSVEKNIFLQKYLKMMHSRGENQDVEKVESDVENVINYFKEPNNGFFANCFLENELIGSLAILYQGDTAFYYMGFADPDFRKYSINHLTFDLAIKKVLEEKLSYFDFGGYAHLASPDSSMFQINRFKEGFGGERLFYAKRMHFTLSNKVYLKKGISKILSFVKS